jgi:hypothetical protein
MTEDRNRATGPQLRSGPMIASAALVGAGALLAVAGLAVAGSHFVAALRRWVAESELSTSDIARLKWAQARAAALAGAEAWQKAPANQPARAS